MLLRHALAVRAAIVGSGPRDGDRHRDGDPDSPNPGENRALTRFLDENVEPGFIGRPPALEAVLASIDAAIDARAGGRTTPFQTAVARLELGALEIDLLLAAIAPSVRRAFREALLAIGPELAPGVHPAAHLVELCASSAATQAQARAALDEDGRLVTSGALMLQAPLGRSTPALWRAVHPSPSLVRFFEGRPSLHPHLDLGSPLRTIVDGNVAERLIAAAEAVAVPHVVLVGEPGSGRTRAAAFFARHLGREALVLAPEAAQGLDPKDEGREALLDGRLRGRLLYLTAASGTLSSSRVAELARLDVPCAVAAAAGSEATALLLAAGFVRVDVPPAGAAAQVEAWKLGLLPNAAPNALPNAGANAVPNAGANALPNAGANALPDAAREASDVVATALADLVRGHGLSLSAIETAATEARSSVGPGDDARALLAAAERAARSATSHRLTDVADRLSTSLSWDDLILPVDVRAAVDEVWRAASARRIVFERWGFGEKTPYGRAISALFSGDPGTGKTMVATLVARELGIELYRVDLSRLVDKYIGETEKHLATLFAEAERGRCAILFDEADSLFAKRTKGGESANERYANLEVNYLLQRIETFSGIAILTTNQESVIDAAFKRRIRYHVHFPFPTVEERARIWRRLLPPEAPLDGDVDVLVLARRYEMSGGHVKSAVLRAAFAAAAAGERLSQGRLVRAADQELENLGKLVRR